MPTKIDMFNAQYTDNTTTNTIQANNKTTYKPVNGMRIQYLTWNEVFYAYDDRMHITPKPEIDSDFLSLL